MRRDTFDERVHFAVLDLLHANPVLMRHLLCNMDILLNHAVKDVKATQIPILHRGTVYH